MRERIRRIHSTTLAVYVALVDAGVWLAALPLELWLRTWILRGHPSTLSLLAILLGNVVLLGLLATAAAATCELVRRGLIQPAPALLRALNPRSKPFVR